MALIKNSNSKLMAREAVVLDLGDLTAQGEFIKREAVAAAERTVQAARGERERIVAGAREEGLKAGRAEGLEKGLAEGRAQGRTEALAAAKESFESLRLRWENAFEAFERAREDLVSEAGTSLLRLSGEIARRVTKRQVEMDPLVVRSQLEAALRLVLAPTRLVIEVHPEEVERAREALPGLMERLGGERHADLRACETLGKGSCVIRSDKGEIDASIATQLERAVAALMGDEGAGSAAAVAPEPPKDGGP